MRAQIRKIAVLVLCLAISLSALFSCMPPRERYDFYSFDYFDTVISIIGYEEDRADFDEKMVKIKEMLDDYHKLFDIYHTYPEMNNLASLNATVDGAHRELVCDGAIIELLTLSKELYQKTNGETNVALGSVLSLWHNERTLAEKHPDKAKLPEYSELLSAAEHTDIDGIVIDREKSTVFLRDPQMTLDVGAVTKGFVCDKIEEYLVSVGATGYLINLGGNVKVVGGKPSGKWKIGIENPNMPSEFIKYLEMTEKSVVTSGSYQRFYSVGGKRYHHIIDKDTLAPAEYFASVSIIAESSLLADALSTALFSMSREDGKALVDGLSGVEAMWVTDSGAVYTTEGFSTFEAGK